MIEVTIICMAIAMLSLLFACVQAYMLNQANKQFWELEKCCESLSETCSRLDQLAVSNNRSFRAILDVCKSATGPLPRHVCVGDVLDALTSGMEINSKSP